MLFAFLLEGVGIIALLKFGHNPYAFVILTGLVFFAWGEIYSLFPAAIGDVFGPRLPRPREAVVLEIVLDQKYDMSRTLRRVVTSNGLR